jgi:hypothetical protein
MNEKIKELIEQTEINFDKDINEVEVCVMLPSDLERFAELIVKDVIDLILTKSRIEQVNKNDKVVILYCDLVNDIREEYGVD